MRSDHISIEFRRHNSEGETPGPIPNPEAKPFSADGTALVTGWESRTPPDILRLCRTDVAVRKAFRERGAFRRFWLGRTSTCRRLRAADPTGHAPPGRRQAGPEAT